jgi:hypothetical protein
LNVNAAQLDQMIENESILVPVQLGGLGGGIPGGFEL